MSTTITYMRAADLADVLPAIETTMSVRAAADLLLRQEAAGLAMPGRYALSAADLLALLVPRPAYESRCVAQVYDHIFAETSIRKMGDRLLGEALCYQPPAPARVPPYATVVELAAVMVQERVALVMVEDGQRHGAAKAVSAISLLRHLCRD